MRFRTEKGGEHAVTIVDERPLNVKTLGRILKDVASHLGVKSEALITELFGK
jgi:hypothetical protein